MKFSVVANLQLYKSHNKECCRYFGLTWSLAVEYLTEVIKASYTHHKPQSQFLPYSSCMENTHPYYYQSKTLNFQMYLNVPKPSRTSPALITELYTILLVKYVNIRHYVPAKLNDHNSHYQLHRIPTYHGLYY